MSESGKFKLSYRQRRENDQVKNDSQANSQIDETENKGCDTAGINRTICFVWADRRKKFFNYLYLVSGELDVGGDLNVITLYFTTEIVTLKGYSLEDLFSLIMNQTVPVIIQDDERYAPSDYDNAYIITEMSVRVMAS